MIMKMKSELLLGDCMTIIPTLEESSIDCVITSPPYNVNLGNNKYNKSPYSLYVDNKEHSDYIKWLKNIFEIIYGKVKSGGRICINIGDGKNGAVPTSSDIIQFMTKELNYLMLSHIIWDKKQTSARTAWGSWKSPQSPSYPCPFEHILIFGKEHRSLQYKGISDLTSNEFTKYAYGIWNIKPEIKAKQIGHPAPFPQELCYRLIKMNTYINGTVLDPFMGSGTTGVVCKNLNRKFIGIEIDENYFNIAKDRIENTKQLQKLF